MCSSETSVVFKRTARCYIPEYSALHNHRSENLILQYGNLSLRLEFDSRQWQDPVSSAKRPDRLWVTHNLYVMCREALSPEIKRQGCEADHSVFPSVEINTRLVSIYGMKYLNCVVFSVLATVEMKSTVF
jgi:hypothetical protein